MKTTANAKPKKTSAKQDELTLALLSELKSLRAERDLYMGYLAVLMTEAPLPKSVSKIMHTTKMNVSKNKSKAHDGKQRT